MNSFVPSFFPHSSFLYNSKFLLQEYPRFIHTYSRPHTPTMYFSMKCFAFFVPLCALSCTALPALGHLPPLGGVIPIQPSADALQTADASLQTPFPHAPLRTLPTPPWLENFTVPVSTAYHTTRALNTTTSTVPTVVSTIATSDDTDFPKIHTMCLFRDGNHTDGRRCLPQIEDSASPSPNIPLATAATPSNLATVPTCTQTLTTAIGLPKLAAATTVTATQFLDCHHCAVETKTNKFHFGHGPAIVTLPRGAPSPTATEKVTKCLPIPILD